MFPVKTSENKEIMDTNVDELRSAKDIISRLIWNIDININDVIIGYANEMNNKIIYISFKYWESFHKTGNISYDCIQQFILKIKNDKNLILWDKKTKLDRIFGSGNTKQNETIKSLGFNQNKHNNKISNNFHKKKINKISRDWNDEKNSMHSHGNIDCLCKFYASGYCFYGNACELTHDSQGILNYQNNWINYKTNYPLLQIKYNPYSVKKQIYDYIIVLDLEGKKEIIEYPCILIDLKQMKEISRFHRFVIPHNWHLDIKNKCINCNVSKYFEINPDHLNDNIHMNWNSNGVSFGKCLQDMFVWMKKYGILLNNSGQYIKNGNIKSKTFIIGICGNWDIKTQIPNQCRISQINLPLFFHKWLNIKDFALSIYKNAKPYQVKGMAPLLRYLNMKLHGTHHLGMDDTYNIANIILRFIKDGSVLVPTAKRDYKTNKVTYTFKNRVNQSTTKRYYNNNNNSYYNNYRY